MLSFAYVKGNDSIPNDSVFISEASIWHGGGFKRWAYCELYNNSSDTVDLSRYFLTSRYRNGSFLALEGAFHRLKYTFTGKLEPGGTHIIMFIPTNTTKNEDAQLIYPNGYYNFDVHTKADELCYHSNELYSRGGYLLNHYAIALFCRVAGSDSVLVDLVNEDDTKVNEPDTNEKPIGGVINAIETNVLVRKSSVKTGNDDWDISRGNDIIDSEWILIPKEQLIDEFAVGFTTIGIHGDFDYSLTSSELSINENNKTISLPYGIRRDSLIRYLELGPNLGYFLKWGEDTSNVYCQNGDTLNIYQAGETAVVHAYALKVEAKTTEFNQIAPLRYKTESGNWNERYLITQYSGTMDTIYNIPFNTRIDTFEKYVVTPDNCDISYTFVDGVERPDFKLGDIVTLKAGDKTRSYYLKVQPYFNNHEAQLKYIVLPGLELWENPETFNYTDTLLNFSPTSYNYYISLPKEITTPPFVLPTPMDSRSNIHIKKPKNLFGSEADRTCSIEVTAEDDTSILVYNIIFNVEREEPQLSSEPFFCDVAHGVAYVSAMNLQIFNPNTDELFLGDYVMFVSPWQKSVNDILKTVNRWSPGNPNKDFKERNEFMFRPGHIFVPMGADSSRSISTIDPMQKTPIMEPHEVYSMADLTAYPFKEAGENSANLIKKVDMICAPSWRASIKNITHDDYIYNVYGTGFTPFNRFDNWCTTVKRSTIALLKIVNDSVKEGTKVFNDPNDFEMTDIINGFDYQGDWILNDTLKVMIQDNYDKLYRKPWVNSGNPIPAASFGTATIPSEWVPYNEKEIFRGRFENHTFNSTFHISYLLSNNYIVSRGLSSEETIVGIIENTSVDDFFKKIIIPDTGMTVTIESAEGIAKSGDDKVISGDKVTTLSTDGNNSVTYTLEVGSGLSNDVTLTSTVYAVDLDARSVSGISMGTSIEDLIGNVSAPSTAQLMIVHPLYGIMGTSKYNNDTILYQNKEKIAIMANDNTLIEVVAQDGETKAQYQLVFDVKSNEAYVLSNSYVVKEDKKVIDFIDDITVGFFLDQLIPAPGATIKIVNKMGQEKSVGWLAYDDKLIVTSEDGSNIVSYYLKFMNEEMPDAINRIGRGNILSVYPNPTTDFITIENTNNFTLLKIYDISGNVVETRNVSDLTHTIDMRKFSTGIYLMVLSDKTGKNNTAKIIKH